MESTSAFLVGGARPVENFRLQEMVQLSLRPAKAPIQIGIGYAEPKCRCSTACNQEFELEPIAELAIATYFYSITKRVSLLWRTCRAGGC